jgi:hypothetical protein
MLILTKSRLLYASHISMAIGSAPSKYCLMVVYVICGGTPLSGQPTLIISGASDPTIESLKVKYVKHKA